MQDSQIQSLCHLFQERVKQTPDQKALTYKKDGVWFSYTWSEFKSQVERVGRALIGLGIAPGDRVGLISENRPEWAFADMGFLHVGAVNVAIYTTNTPEQVAYILKDSAAKAVFVSHKDYLSKVLSVCADLPNLKTIICFHAPLNLKSLSQKHSIQILSWNDFLSLGKEINDQDLQNIWQKLNRSDLATLIYTSGTTGDPKGVMLSHGNLVTNALACRDAIPPERDPVCFSFLPLCHAFERMAGYYYPIAAGVRIAYAESLDKIIQNLSEVKPTRFSGVPRIFEKIHARVLDQAQKSSALKKSIFDWAMKVGEEVMENRFKGKLSSLRSRIRYHLADQLVFQRIKKLLGGRIEFLNTGGAALAPEIARFFDIIGVPILQGYGLTETSPVCTMNRPDDYRHETVGTPVPGIQIRIAPDGEILIKGPNVMQGYLNRPQDTREVLSEEGWFATGDIGEITPDGHLRITDRKKDLIVTAGGKNISPQNIENKLKLNPYVEQVCVLGDKRKYLSCLIVPNFDNLQKFAQEKRISYANRMDLNEKEEVQKLFQKSLSELNSGLASYETLKKFTLLSDEFSQEKGEITPTLKVKRKVIQEKYGELINKMY